MRELSEVLARRAGVASSTPETHYRKLIDTIRAAPAEELEPALRDLRRGVAELEQVVDGQPGSSVSLDRDQDEGSGVVRPRRSEYDDWARRELGEDGEATPPPITVL